MFAFIWRTKVGILDSIKNPEDTIDINVKGTCSLLEACSAKRVKTFIFASWSRDSVRKNSISPGIRKTSTRASFGIRSKQTCGRGSRIRIWQFDENQECVSLRIFNVYGRNQTSRYAGVVTRFASRLGQRYASNNIWRWRSNKGLYFCRRCC